MSALLSLFTIVSLAASPALVDVGSGYTSVYALVGDGGIVLIDSHNPGHEDDIVRRLERAELDPDDVTLVLVTHAHRDHAGSATALAERLGVPIALGSGDVRAATAGHNTSPVTGGRARLLAPLLRSSFPPVHPDVVVNDTLDLGPYGVEAQARQVGGHTHGSLIVEVAGGTVLTGDLIRSRLFRRHTPTLHFFHEDGVEAHGVLQGLLADDAVHTVLPAHGDALAADDVRSWLATRAPRHHDRLERLADDQPTGSEPATTARALDE